MLILTTALLTAAMPVSAQVTVDLHALQALPERPAGGRPSRPAQSTLTPAPSVATRERTAPLAAPSASPPAVRPTMPESVPDTATIAPIEPAAPPPGAQPPPAPPISDTAATAAAPITSGLRLTFAPGQSDLNPDSAASIKQLVQASPAADGTTFNVLAYAPGKPDDPSTARRISLSRAMAVRSALVADGVPSARIVVRALGEPHGDGPPDRVDLSVNNGNTSNDTATSR